MTVEKSSRPPGRASAGSFSFVQAIDRAALISARVAKIVLIPSIVACKSAGTLNTFINAKISAPSSRKTLKESFSVREGFQRLNLLHQIFPCRTGKYLGPAVEKFRS